MIKISLTSPLLRNTWFLALIIVNLGGGITFIDNMAGKSAIASLVGATVVMLIVYWRHGYVRLLGLGPALFWTPMQIEFSLILANENPTGLFHAWVLIVLVVNGITLTLGVINVFRYMQGNTQPLNNSNKHTQA